MNDLICKFYKDIMSAAIKEYDAMKILISINQLRFLIFYSKSFLLISSFLNVNPLRPEGCETWNQPPDGWWQTQPCPSRKTSHTHAHIHTHTRTYVHMHTCTHCLCLCHFLTASAQNNHYTKAAHSGWLVNISNSQWSRKKQPVVIWFPEEMVRHWVKIQTVWEQTQSFPSISTCTRETQLQLPGNN